MIATLTPAPVTPAVCQPAQPPVEPTSSPATASGTGLAGGATFRTPGACATARSDCDGTSAWTPDPAPGDLDRSADRPDRGGRHGGRRTGDDDAHASRLDGKPDLLRPRGRSCGALRARDGCERSEPRIEARGAAPGSDRSRVARRSRPTARSARPERRLRRRLRPRGARAHTQPRRARRRQATTARETPSWTTEDGRTVGGAQLRRNGRGHHPPEGTKAIRTHGLV